MKEAGMLKSTNYRTLLTLLLILISVSLLGYLPEVKAPSIALTSGGLGILACPNGDQHEGAISISATTTPTMRGEYDIDIPMPNGSSLFKSGVFNYVDVHPPSDAFKLVGKETRDDICGTLETIGSIPITITGECVVGGVVSMLKFTWSNGETANFPGDPTCS
jgi:hypothetical protein